MTSTQWADAQIKGEVTGVTINSPPVVTFKVTDAAGNGILGLEKNTSKSSTALLAGYTNVAFSIAKLVPGTNGSPSKWVSYIVTTAPTTTTASIPGRPTTDNTGTLESLGGGAYKYTFYRDIKLIKAAVDAAAETATNKNADLGDLTYDPSLTHRVVVQISGNARGTGSNTADAVTVATAVPLKNPVNLIYDFIPATGKAVTDADTQREIVKVAACFECHSKFTFHGGNALTGVGGARQDTRMCVVCHTDQRKYGRAEATTTATGYSGSTLRINGKSVTDLPTFVHKLHMGERLTKTGYNAANILLNDILYPQPVTNCVKCHTGSSTATNKTAQGDNWKNVPNRAACGACHDGIDFVTGLGTTVAGATTGHGAGGLGGAQADDSKCGVCHTPTAIPIHHVTVDPTGSSGRAGYPANTAQDVPTPGYPSGQGPSIPLASQLNMPAGVYKINYEISKVTVAGAAGARKATVVYRILKDGQPVTLNSTGYLMDNVAGTPNIYVTYAVTQDGITAPADFNASISTTVTNVRDAKTGNSGGTQTGPDASGWYTATLNAIVPDAAKMVTGIIGINYQGWVQLGHAAYPNGIRLREPEFVRKLADGYSPRRSIVSNAKCNNCHGQLGIEPSFHGGARNNGEGCATGGCHDANKNTGHTGAANSYGGGWSVAIKNLVHGIHSSAKRENAFTYEATVANPNGFDEVEYPGVLRNCEQCHVAGSYDFSATANSAAVSNLLWTTDAKTDMSNPTSAPSIGLSPWVTTLGSGQVSYVSDNLVSSPISSSCFGCHDSKPAVSHMQLNGGTLVSRVSTASNGVARPAIGANGGFSFTKAETCLVCHASGKVADIKAVHSN